MSGNDERRGSRISRHLMGSSFEMGEKGELEHLNPEETRRHSIHVQNQRFEMGEKGELTVKNLPIRTVEP